jgi:4-amino-4-deoxy-L-arabinose transferase-like glycosyltransferase
MTQRKKFDYLALLACFILALVIRLPNLTVFITADEARSWYGRSIIFLDALSRNDWASTAPGSEAPFINNVSLSPAPGVTTMWGGAIGLVLLYLRQGLPTSLSQFLLNLPFDPLEPAVLFWLRAPGVLIAAGAVGLTYWWSRALLGQWGAILLAALWALDPFSAALARVLGHDSLVSIFMWLSLLAFLRSLTNRPNSGGLLPSPFILTSGALAGLACLSKYPALSIGLFIALTMLAVYLGRAFTGQQWLALACRYWLRDMLGWSLAAALVFTLLWPAMWVQPSETVIAVFGDALRASGAPHPKGSFFLGQPAPDPGWQFYPLVALLRTTPVVLVGLVLALSLWLFSWRFLVSPRTWVSKLTRSVDTSQENVITHHLPILLAYVLFYILLVTYGGKKQDRYLLPLFPALTMLATLGFLYLARIKERLTRLTWLGVSLLLALQTLFVLPTFPYFFSYYNPLVGGGPAATRLLQVGWGEGLNEAAAYLNSLPQAESLQVVSWYSTAFEPYFKGESIYKIDDEKISRSSKPGLAADYVVFYVNQLQRQLPSQGALQFFRSTPPVYTVTINSIDYAWIYPSIQMQYVFSGEVRLVGQSELLGYNLKDEAGRPVVSTYPESVIFLSMFWEWQGQAPADQLRISLVDDENKTRGWGNFIETVAPIPRSEWLDGMIVRDEFALVIFPDTPPGDYRLSAWIERTTTTETVGVFPLDEVTISIVSRPEVQ